MTGSEAIAIANSAVGAVLAFVLLLAIIGKVRSFGAFTIVTLGGLGINFTIARPIALIVLVSEAYAAAALASGRRPELAAFVAFVLFGAFTIVGLYAAIAHLSVSCGCFGATRLKLGVRTASRSAVLAVLAAAHGFAAWVGYQPNGSVILLFVALLVIGKWWFDWKWLSRPLAWRNS